MRVEEGESGTVWRFSECRRCGHEATSEVIAQPKPTPNGGCGVWDAVIDDMRGRDALGRSRYGTKLQPGNGRDALRDAYEEALDLAVYLKQALLERDAQRAGDP